MSVNCLIVQSVEETLRKRVANYGNDPEVQKVHCGICKQRYLDTMTPITEIKSGYQCWSCTPHKYDHNMYTPPTYWVLIMTSNGFGCKFKRFLSYTAATEYIAHIRGSDGVMFGYLLRGTEHDFGIGPYDIHVVTHPLEYYNSLP